MVMRNRSQKRPLLQIYSFDIKPLMQVIKQYVLSSSSYTHYQLSNCGISCA